MAEIRLPPIDRGELPCLGEQWLYDLLEQVWRFYIWRKRAIKYILCPTDPNRCERAYTGNTIGQVCQTQQQSNACSYHISDDDPCCRQAILPMAIAYLLFVAQANAVSDKVLDLRMCDFTGKDLSGKTLSGALLKNAVLLNSTLRETVLTKARSPPHIYPSEVSSCAGYLQNMITRSALCVTVSRAWCRHMQLELTSQVCPVQQAGTLEIGY